MGLFVMVIWPIQVFRYDTPSRRRVVKHMRLSCSAKSQYAYVCFIVLQFLLSVSMWSATSDASFGNDGNKAAAAVIGCGTAAVLPPVQSVSASLYWLTHSLTWCTWLNWSLQFNCRCARSMLFVWAEERTAATFPHSRMPSCTRSIFF